MMKVLASKVDDVAFEIGRKYDGIIWVLRDGEMYLAHKDLYFTDGQKWYCVPIDALESISVVSENPLKVKFSLPNVNVIVTGKNASRLLALRHLLLPYIHDREIREIKTVLKLWYLGIRSTEGIATVLESELEKVKAIVSRAMGEGYIDKNGDLTEKGLSVFSEEEVKLLKEVRNG
ncbi:MAG: hypothetical protein DRN20_01685 [Thermoplasmata archaeon]|nr:MAG: hypothetical protein DRN20_01685 [Thermoplasmata archaeon]